MRPLDKHELMRLAGVVFDGDATERRLAAANLVAALGVALEERRELLNKLADLEARVADLEPRDEARLPYLVPGPRND